jgi:hypothetical protein
MMVEKNKWLKTPQTVSLSGGSLVKINFLKLLFLCPSVGRRLLTVFVVSAFVGYFRFHEDHVIFEENFSL